jgi:hypothetical protein
MRATTHPVRRPLALALVGLGFAGAFTLRGHAAATPSDADLFVLSGRLTTTTSMSVTPGMVSYSVDPATKCLSVDLPSPVSTSVPGFVDLSRGESGPCTGVTGTGNFNVVGCSTGSVDGDWLITEPSGDNAHFVGAGVMIGGVAIMATAPAGTYTDDGRGGGGGAAVALLLPHPLTGCGALNAFDLIGVVGGAY